MLVTHTADIHAWKQPEVFDFSLLYHPISPTALLKLFSPPLFFSFLFFYFSCSKPFLFSPGLDTEVDGGAWVPVQGLGGAEQDPCASAVCCLHL